jgi:hypothetical protein
MYFPRFLRSRWFLVGCLLLFFGGLNLARPQPGQDNGDTTVSNVKRAPGAPGGHGTGSPPSVRTLP